MPATSAGMTGAGRLRQLTPGHQDSACDARRDAWLRAGGWCVLRFPNRIALTQTVGVAAAIMDALRSTDPRHQQERTP